MVDTINPQTGKEDEFFAGQQAAPTNNTFYSGFSRPEDVHVNLASGGENTQSPKVEGINQSNQVNGTGVSNNHQVYAASSFNPRPLIFAVVIGFVTILITFLLASFITGAVYNGKLKTEEETLASLKENLNTQASDVKPLEPPVEAPKEEPTNTPTPAPETPKVEEKPIETPVQPSSSYANGQG